jgi:renalase
METTDTLVIGAGLAGLTVARHLRERGVDLVVIEKSRSPGGRIATRRSDFGSFDHGAQYLTSRTPEFTATVNRLVQTGNLAPWRPDGKDSARPWWVGQPGMSAFCKTLAEDLDLRLETEATRITRANGRYAVRVETREAAATTVSAARIIAAIPAPQAAELLSPLDSAFGASQNVRMAPCWAAMLAFETRLDRVPDIARGGPDDIVAFMARNGSKPGERERLLSYTRVRTGAESISRMIDRALPLICLRRCEP